MYNAQHHIYEMKNDFPLSHSHHAYLASKPPIRKNKDYRPRPRNYVIGFPVYRKDAYNRHLYTINDIFTNKTSPLIVYSKVFGFGYLAGTLYKYIAMSLNNKSSVFAERVSQTHFTNYNTFNPFKGVSKSSQRQLQSFALCTAISFTLYTFISNKYKDNGFSEMKSNIYSAALITPFIYMCFYDNVKFPLTSKLFVLALIIMFLRGLVNTYKHINNNANLNAVYIKSVTPEQKLDIESRIYIEKKGFQLYYDYAYDLYCGNSKGL